MKNKKSFFIFLSVSSLLFYVKGTVLFLAVAILIFSSTDVFKHKTIHIYMDKGTIPALLQMIDIAKANPQEPKLIIWDRFSEINTYFNLSKYSITQIEAHLSSSEKIMSFINQYANADIVIHYNIHHEELFESIINKIPSQKIKRVHIYEDGIGYLFIVNSKDNVMQKKYPYPVTFHLKAADYFNTSLCYKVSRCFELQQMLRDKRTEPINFSNLTKTLTKKQKKIIYQLTNTDIISLKKLLSLHPTHLYLIGWNGTGDQEEKHQASFLYKWCMQKEDSFYTRWFYKDHPSFAATHYLPLIQAACPQAKEFPSHIPFEILILADLVPDKVSGYSSSVFFGLESNQISNYITRDDEQQAFILKELGILKANQIVNGNHPPFDATLLNKKSILLRFNGWNDNAFFESEKRLCRLLSTTDCADVIETSPTKLVLKWQNSQPETFIKQADGSFQQE